MRETVRKDPEHGVQLVKDASGVFQEISWGRLYREAEAFGAGLLRLGIKRGDHVGIISDNMKEWLWADLAVISIGAADVPRGSDSMPQEIRFILDHADCALVLAENRTQMEKILSVKRDLKALKTLIVLDPAFEKRKARIQGVVIHRFAEVQELGREYLQGHPGCVDEEIDKSTPRTSSRSSTPRGRRGSPKG